MFGATNLKHPNHMFEVIIFTGKISSVTCRMMIQLDITMSGLRRPFRSPDGPVSASVAIANTALNKNASISEPGRLGAGFRCDC